MRIHFHFHKSLRDMLVVVESMFAVCAELSPSVAGTVEIGALGFNDKIGITISNQMRTWIVDTLTAHTLETSRITDLDTSSDVRSERQKRQVAFVIAARARMCEAQSGTEGGMRTARRTRSMICIRSEAMPRTLSTC